MTLCACEGNPYRGSQAPASNGTRPLEDHMQTTSAPFPEPAPPVLTRASLRPDCANCFALCCTALGFTRSADFAVDKPAGSACSNLSAADYSCTIHDSLRPRGFRGCTVFDCLGAGQTVSQGLFGGQSWRQHPETQNQMFAAFRIVRQLHEMLWHLTEAQERTFDPDLSLQAARLRTGIERFIGGGLAALLDLDVQNLHLEVRALLIEVSEEVRAPYFAAGGDHLEPALQPGADLMGHSLKFRQLCGADLRGAYLIEADLRGSDLSGADLLGADLREARLDGADLSRALLLTQPQLNSAGGSAATALPPDVSMPAHWDTSQ